MTHQEQINFATKGAHHMHDLTSEVAAVVAYPRFQNFSLAPWSLGPLLTELARRRLPLLLPLAETGWDEVFQLCRDHPSLPLVVTGLNYRQLRYLLPLWEHCPNLYVDLSWLSVHDGLAFLAGRGLLGRVLFGTNYPRSTPGAAVTMVTYANITEDERGAVAGGTLRTLIGNAGRDLT